MHCSKQAMDNSFPCRDYIISNETDITENPDQHLSPSWASLAWVWVLVAGAIALVLLIIYMVAKSANRVLGRIEYEEVKGDDWVVNHESQ